MKEFNGFKCYDVDEVSEKLDLHKVSVRKYLRNGKLVGVKIGKKWWVYEKNLNKFIVGEKTNFE